MPETMVSVIIPAYNAESTLRQCLDSTLNQAYGDYEVIVVDNNSNDGTRGIIDEFRSRDKKIKYIFEAKPGRGAARHAGEMNSGADIILMTDSDCILPPDWIAEMAEPIVKNKTELVQGIKKPVIINYWTSRIQNEIEAIDRNEGKSIGSLDTANFAVKRSLLRDIGYTNPGIQSGEDTELLVKLKIRGHRLYFKRVEVLHYHPDTALKVFQRRFLHGTWNARMRKAYRTRKELFSILSDISKTDHVRYFRNIILELLTFHENAKYDLVTGIGWRLGLLNGWVRNTLEL